MILLTFFIASLFCSFFSTICSTTKPINEILFADLPPRKPLDGRGKVFDCCGKQSVPKNYINFLMPQIRAWPSRYFSEEQTLQSAILALEDEEDDYVQYPKNPWIYTQFINAKDENGNTLLHHACCFNKYNVVSFLLKANADTFILNKQGMYPFGYINDQKMLDKFLLILGKSILFVADKQEKRIINYIQEKAVTTRKLQDESPLQHIARTIDHENLVTYVTRLMEHAEN